MRIIAAFAMGLFLSVAALAQSTPVYDESVSVVDSSGNLLVVDTGFTVTTVSTTGSTASSGGSVGTVFLNSLQPIISRTPTTRVTVVPRGASTASPSVVYSGVSFQVIGAGQYAVYAVVTIAPTGTSKSSTQELVAIDAGTGLPGSVAGFPGVAITSGDSIQLGPAVGSADYLSIISPAMRATPVASAASRTAKVYSFTTTFSLLSQGALP